MITLLVRKKRESLLHPVRTNYNTHISHPTHEYYYLQHKVLFPRWVITPNRNGGGFDILKFQCHIRIKFICKKTKTREKENSVINDVIGIVID